MPHRMDAGGPGLIGDRGENLGGIPLAQHDLRTPLSQRFAKTLQRVVKPPFRSRAIGMISAPILVVNEDREDLPGLGRRMQSRLILHAQIAP
jgi:hypothetical protein